MAHHSGLGIYLHPHIPRDCQPAPILNMLQNRCTVQSSVHPRLVAGSLIHPVECREAMGRLAPLLGKPRARTRGMRVSQRTSIT